MMTGNYETDTYQEWYPVYRVQNGKAKYIYGATDERRYEYGGLEQGSLRAIDPTITFLKRNNIKTVYTIGQTELKEFLGVDLEFYPYDEETDIDSYQEYPLNDNYLIEALKKYKIKLKIIM